jgi:tetratricopeptide (TPR) repeat protein
VRTPCALITGSIVVVALLCPARGATTEDSTDTPLSQAMNDCASDLKDLEKERANTVAGLEDFSKELAAAAPQPDKGRSTEGPPIQPSVIVESAEQLKWAESIGQQAQQALAAARAAPNPEVARVFIKDAELKTESARNIIQRIASGLRATTRDAGPVPHGGVALDLGGSSAYLQLKRAAGLGDKTYGASTSEARADLADFVRYDPSTAQGTTDRGRVVSVRPLAAAFRSTRTGRGELFEAVPVPGRSPVYRLSDEARSLLMSPDSRKRLDTVGGVELQVTLDLLGFLGIPEFRKPGPATLVDAPVLVSLGELAAEASRYTSPSLQWGNLPEGLRYPGGIERVHGFALDSRGRDVFLVGARARSPARRIDLDSVIVALQSVWIEGRTPAVSLDSIPEDPGGPQYVRVISVPPTSTFARIMLDADYAMKRAMLGKLSLSAPGYQPYAALVAANPTSNSQNRFWFYPAPLGPHDAHVSGTARSIVFDSSLRLLTESERVIAGGFSGTGVSDETASHAARLFTSAIDTFEQSSQVEPEGIFTRLHGLVDLVTLCKIWRDMGFDHPALKALSRLPVRELRGRDAVPTYYPGLSVVVAEDARGTLSLSGGVFARARATNRSFDRYQDVVSRTLESAVDSFPSGRLAQAIPIKFTLPHAGSDSDDRVERLLLAGQAEMGLGHFAAARKSFREATAANPFHADAWAFLAETESQLGNHPAALAAVAKAIALEPLDSAIRGVALDTELKANPRLDLESKDPATLRALSEDYSARAAAALADNRMAEARRYAETAIKLWDNNGVAYITRAWTSPEQSGPEATRDWIEAIRALRKLLRVGQGEQATRPLALALAMRAFVRVGRTSQSLADAGQASDLLDELERAVDEAEEARQLDPSQPLAIVTEATARAWRVAILDATGRHGNISTASQLADQAIREFPDFPPAHLSRSSVLWVANDVPGAIRELTELIRLDPTALAAYEQRAELEIEAHQCAAARADINQIERHHKGVSAALADHVRQCAH